MRLIDSRKVPEKISTAIVQGEHATLRYLATTISRNAGSGNHWKQWVLAIFTVPQVKAARDSASPKLQKHWEQVIWMKYGIA